MATKRVQRRDLAGLEITSETCLISVDPDGMLYLTHVEADVTWPAEDGGYSEQRFGTIAFDGEIRLPLGQFRWTWVADDHALMIQRGTAPTGHAPAAGEGVRGDTDSARNV